MTLFVVVMVIYIICCSVILTYAMNNKKLMSVLYVFLWLVGLVAISYIYYHLECNRYTDFVRIMQESETADSWNDYSELFNDYSIAPGSALLIAFFTLIGNIYYLKAFSALTFFTCIMFLCWKMLDKGFSNQVVSTSLLCVLAVTNLSYLADTIRFPMGSAIFAAAAINYLCFSGNRISTYIICFLSCLIHISLWPFFIIMILNDCIYGKIRTIIKIITLFYFIILQQCIELITNINPALGWKMELYFNPDGQYYESLISKQQILFSLAILLIDIALVLYSKCGAIRRFGVKAYDYVCWVCFLVAGSFPSNVTFSRLVPLLILLSFPLICSKLEEADRIRDIQYGRMFTKQTPLLNIVFYIFIIVCFVVRCAYSYQPFYIE